jgi:hypothetical protein
MKTNFPKETFDAIPENHHQTRSEKGRRREADQGNRRAQDRG